MTCKSVFKDHNGNKRDHSLFFVSSLVVIGKPWNFAMYELFYLYLLCAHNILYALYCFNMYVANL